MTSLKRVSLTATGKEANSHSKEAEFSPDGKLVVFVSSADNLVPKDTNQRADVFIKNIATGAIKRVSTSSTNAQADGQSFQPSFSASGKQVVFISSASNLVPGKTNPGTGIFIKDLITGKVTAVSRSFDGTLLDYADVRQVRFTTNSKSIVFDTNVDGLVPDDTNGLRDIFLQNIETSEVTLLSESQSGENGNDESRDFAVSKNGLFVAFSSIASNLVSKDTNESYDIFVKNLKTKSVVRVSLAKGGGELDSHSTMPVFTANSQFIGYESSATKFAPNGPANGNSQIVMSTIKGGFVRVISSTAGGKFGDDQSSDVNFSKDGRFATFASQAFNFAPIDFFSDKIFVKNLKTGKVTLITDNGPSVDPSFSPSGKQIVFTSSAGLLGNDLNSDDDIYVAKLR